MSLSYKVDRIIDQSHEILDGIARANEKMDRLLAAQAPQSPSPSLSSRDSSFLVKEVFQNVMLGRIIEAIKAHRQLTGMALKESKDEIDALRHYYLNHQ